MLRSLLALLLVAAVAAACTRNEAAETPPVVRADTAGTVIPYALGRPDVAFALPPVLREISGLTALGPDRLGAVQDEEGLLFVLDTRTGTIIERYPFAGHGDYEGVEAVGDTVWVIESDGTLYEVTGLAAGAPATVRHGTSLHSRCDAEGLGYDAAGHRLLIACKTEAGPELSGVRAIYAFDLRKKRLSGGPVLLLDRRPLDANGTSFKPSALAVHPRTSELYVLSASRRALAVFAPDGALTAAVALPSGRYPQPEGITFLPDGTLFIASEGGHGAATLLRFAETPP